jgi:RNA polymerase sigma factor (sigma-70 family)
MIPPTEPAPPAEEGRDGQVGLLELLARAQGGSESAREALFEACYPRVLAIVRARLGGGLRRFHESGDVVQEALLLAARDLDRLQVPDERSLIAWLSRVVENRLRDMAKFHAAAKREAGRERREASLVGEDESKLLEEVGALADGTPSQVFAGREEHERLERALAELEPKRRKVIELRKQGLSWSEVAQALELASDGAARMLHARALVELGRWLAPKGLDPE